MRNRTTLLRAEQSRAEQSRAEQSRAEQRLTAPFLRPVGRLKPHIAFVMDNRRILTGLVYPVRFGGFIALFRAERKAPGEGHFEKGLTVLSGLRSWLLLAFGFDQRHHFSRCDDEIPGREMPKITCDQIGVVFPLFHHDLIENQVVHVRQDLIRRAGVHVETNRRIIAKSLRILSSTKQNFPR